MGQSVDWDLARRIAGRVAGSEPFAESSNAELEADLLELTTEAEERVAAETGLHSNAGAARARVTDRDGWIAANLASFDRLMRPLLGSFEDDEPESRIGQLLAPVSDAVGSRVAAAELGAMLGWMSRRVIGQYDLLIIEDERPEDQDWVYYVGPNVRNLENRYGFPPREFRLWIALHECTHRAQFTGVEWLRPYFLSLVNELLESVDPDAGNVLEKVKEIAAAKRSGEGPSLADGGLSAFLASPEQKLTLDKMTGLMSLLEGHGDITMDRAGGGLIPSQPRFARVMAKRRKQAKGANKMIQRVLGFEAKLAQYEEGEKFILAVEDRGGRTLFDRVWEAPEHLPDIAEIREPELWVERMAATS